MGLEKTEIILIPKVFNEKLELTAARVGFVFPVYVMGLPRMVNEFLQNLDLRKVEYVFAIAK